MIHESDLIRMGVKFYLPIAKSKVNWLFVATWAVIIFGCSYFWGAVIKAVWKAWMR